MKIGITMDLGELAQRMGSDATKDQARKMRDLLVASYDGLNTEDVDEQDWNGMIEESL